MWQQIKHRYELVSIVLKIHIAPSPKKLTFEKLLLLSLSFYYHWRLKEGFERYSFLFSAFESAWGAQVSRIFPVLKNWFLRESCKSWENQAGRPEGKLFRVLTQDILTASIYKRWACYDRMTRLGILALTFFHFFFYFFHHFFLFHFILLSFFNKSSKQVCQNEWSDENRCFRQKSKLKKFQLILQFQLNSGGFEMKNGHKFELNARKWLTISQGFIFNLAFFTCFISFFRLYFAVVVSLRSSNMKAWKEMTFNRKKEPEKREREREREKSEMLFVECLKALNAIKFRSAEN